MLNLTATSELASLTHLAVSQYAEARRLMPVDTDLSDYHFASSSHHAMQAGMLAGEHDLVLPEALEGHLALRPDYDKGRALGIELQHLKLD